MDKSKDIKFSVIIPSYNNPEELSELLLSVQKHCPSIGGHEVIVADDGSSDDSIEKSCGNFDFVTYLMCEENRGVASARNAGAALAKHGILIFIDSDGLVESDFIAVLKQQFKNKDVVAVSGTHTTTPANPSPYRNYWSIYKYFNMPTGKHTTLFTGQQGAIRKEVFEKTGRWDSNIRGVSKEEYEFTERLELLGYKINYEPGFIVRPRYKGCWSLLSENFRRTKKWCIIFLSRRKFDDYTSTFTGGMSYMLGALTLISGALAFFFPVVKYGFVLIFGLYMALTMPFWIYIYKKRSLLFMTLCYVFHITTSLFIFLGALNGFTYLFASKKARREAINN